MILAFLYIFVAAELVTIGFLAGLTFGMNKIKEEEIK